MKHAALHFQAGIVALLAVCNATLRAEPASISEQSAGHDTISFPSADGLEITADLYRPHAEPSAPWIVLCHQAGWSRGEYRQIAPRLGKLGFNCLAIDQRSGKAVEGVLNETAQRAVAAGKGVAFLDAEQDMVAAIRFARQHHASGKLLLWGSSYSAALALRIAGEHSELVDGVLAFAPGEYFARFGKPKDWIAQSAAKIRVPTLITSAKKEGPRWQSIYAKIPGDDKVQFLPQTAGNHGSRALWGRFTDSEDYWTATDTFLVQFQ